MLAAAGGSGPSGAGGSGPGLDGDFLSRYRLVSAKLRRRFLRKPNVAEAAEQFAALARELRAQEALPYAAWCQLAVARCVRDTGRPTRAAAALQRAAELLAAARLPLEALRCLAERASCLLLGRDYAGALATLTRAQALAGAGLGGGAPGGAFLDVLARCEVSRVLLLLLLQPPPAKLLPEHARTLEQYFWEAPEGGAGQGPRPGVGGGLPPAATYLPAELFLLLQSAVLACQEKDAEALKALQAELWPLLSAEQNHLLHLVLQEMLSPAGQGL
ncbi:F8I2 protein, partial [Upupa epops]|nr:F8I2 protein [Upupa epops]